MNINAAFMATPPIEERAVDENGKLTDIWKNHFDAISQALGLVIVHDRFNNTKQETPVTVVITMSEANRNQLDNAINGTIIYNETTNRFNFRESDAWWTFTRVAA
jgi:hypothetical protein